jgi:hypothetical protein
MIDSLGMSAFSCRVVNEGDLPVQIRAVRLFFGGGFFDRVGKGLSIPFPETNSSLERYLWENEVRIPMKEEEPDAKVLPITLGPTESVRFATWEGNLKHDLKSAGLHGPIRFRVGVIDHRDTWHTVGSSADLGPPAPKQPLP